MNIIIAGSRTLANCSIVKDTVNRLLEELKIEVTCVFSGCTKGPDNFGKAWAEEKNIPVKEFPADWKAYGRDAGKIRNLEMLEEADILIAFWDRSSRGTRHIIANAFKKEKRVIIFPVTIGNLDEVNT